MRRLVALSLSFLFVSAPALANDAGKWHCDGKHHHGSDAHKLVIDPNSEFVGSTDWQWKREPRKFWYTVKIANKDIYQCSVKIPENEWSCWSLCPDQDQ